MPYAGRPAALNKNKIEDKLDYVDPIANKLDEAVQLALATRSTAAPSLDII